MVVIVLSIPTLNNIMRGINFYHFHLALEHIL